MKYIAFVILVCLGMQASAQEVYSSSGRPVDENNKTRVKKDKGFDASNIIFGGGFGFGFGTVTNVNVAPIVGYRFSDNFSAGLGMGYQYYRIKNFFTVYDPSIGTQTRKPLNSNSYSPSVWMRYVLWNNIFAHVEYEHNFMTYKEYYNDTIAPGNILSQNVKYNAPSLLVGGGLRQPVSERVSIIVMGLYDVIQDKYSPYRGTIAIRFGIVAGF
jgi:hypothetical protein